VNKYKSPEQTRAPLSSPTHPHAPPYTCCFTAQVLEAAAERLQDYDDKVRIAAVQSVASVAADSYSGVPQQVMEAASMRLRDTKLPVRKAALAALLGVFKAKVARSE
jgi:hypothetical protein